MEGCFVLAKKQQTGLALAAAALIGMSICPFVTRMSFADEIPVAESGESQTLDDQSGVAELAEAEPIRFSFQHAPWEDVLKWLAERSNLSFSTDVVPEGTFNYIDNDRTFTTDQAIDLVNSYLLIKGYTLVRRNKMLLVLDLEDDVDKSLVRDLLTETPLDKLDQRGDYEITKTRFTLNHVDAADAEKQLAPLLSPVGSLVVIPKAKQILATETGATLRGMRDILELLEKAAVTDEQKKLHAFSLKVASADEVLSIARPLLGIDEDANAAEDGSIRISADPVGRTVFATGSPDKVQLVEQIVKQVDTSGGPSGPAIEPPQFMAHRVNSTDPDAVLRVLQTLFVGDPVVRLEVDRGTGSIIAYARASQHRSIKATIEEMERNPERFAVIPLRDTDPAAATLLVEKLFSGTTTPPVVDGTIDPPQLVVRGTQSQIQQIRGLLDEMSMATYGASPRYAQRGKVRTIQLDPEAVRTVIESIQRLWPKERNPIRIIESSDSNILHTLRPRVAPTSGGDGDDDPQPVSPRQSRQPDETRRSNDPSRLKTRVTQIETDELSSPLETDNPEIDDTDNLETQPPQIDESETDDPETDDSETDDPETDDPKIDDDPAEPTEQPEPDARGESDPAGPSDERRDTLSDIVIAPTPDGLMISSDDLAALDAIESLIESLGQTGSDRLRFHLAYLKHVEAEAARTLLTSILTGVGDATPATLLTASTNASASGVIGSLLQQGRLSSSSSTIGVPHIVADNRLNALFVHGTSSQIDAVKQLLDVIDAESGPEEVLTFPKPKFIPVYYTTAESVAAVVRQVYANRIEGAQNNMGNDQQRRGRDDDFRGFGRGFFGGGRGGDGDRRSRGQNQQPANDLPKMSLGVDVESNSLVVSAPGPLLKEVEAVVAELDRRAAEKPPETISIVTLRRTTPESVRQALAVLGDKVQTGDLSQPTTSGNGNNNTRQDSRRDRRSDNDNDGNDNNGNDSRRGEQRRSFGAPQINRFGPENNSNFRGNNRQQGQFQGGRRRGDGGR
jgi:type II secretory pathway component GspD/PulD (secretin)